MSERQAAQALRLDPRVAVAVALGGALGALARQGLTVEWPADGRSWPWATFAANLIGTAILGLLLASVTHLPPRAALLRPFLAAGFCGALTTFSTLQVELIRLGQHGHAGLAVAYLAASLGGGLLLAATGWHALTPVRRRVTDT